MPFTVNSAKLPDSVKKLPAKRKRQWVTVWNSVFAETEDEGRAFAAANSAIQKERTVTDFVKQVPIEKIDEDAQIVWGWFYVDSEGGVPCVDHSGDGIDGTEIQKAAWGFVSDSRRGGELHVKDAGEIVESMYFSKEIQDALGIDLGRTGWFGGYHVKDPVAWEKVKDGTYTAFSIGGSGEEVAV